VSRHQKCHNSHPSFITATNCCCTDALIPLIIVFHLLWSVTSRGFNSSSSVSLSTTYFQVFLGLPLCLAAQPQRFLPSLHYPTSTSGFWWCRGSARVMALPSQPGCWEYPLLLLTRLFKSPAKITVSSSKISLTTWNTMSQKISFFLFTFAWLRSIY